jgi:hypothetical protein
MLESYLKKTHSFQDNRSFDWIQLPVFNDVNFQVFLNRIIPTFSQ